MKLCKTSFAKRREILNNIPKGMYCYTPKNFPCAENNWVYEIECCPYWKSIGKQRAKCTLLGVKDKYPQALTLLWDQCKLCGYKYDWS